MTATSNNGKQYGTEDFDSYSEKTSNGDDSFIDLSQPLIKASSDPMTSSTYEEVQHKDCQAAAEEQLTELRQGNHSAQIQFERDCKLITEAMLSLSQAEGKNQAQFLIAVYALLLSGDVYYCSKADSIFNPTEKDCSQFQNPQYHRLSDQPEASEPLPIVALLCHGSRLLFEMPVDLRNRVFEWLAKAGDQSFYPRLAASHGINQRAVPIQLGNKESYLQEGKLCVTETALETTKRLIGNWLNFSTDQLYGINLALGGIAKLNPISQKPVTNNGEHGHAFLYANSVDSKAPGGLLLGIEPSAFNCADQYGGAHTIDCAPQVYSATGGDRFDLTSKQLGDFSEAYQGLNSTDLAGYYENLKIVMDEGHFSRAQILANYLNQLILNETSTAKLTLEKLLMSVGFINPQKTKDQPPAILQSLQALGEQFCFRTQDGKEFEFWGPKLNEIPTADISSLKKEYHYFLNNCLQVLEDNNSWQSNGQHNVFVSTLETEQEASSRQVQYGCARLPQMKTSAILGQYLTLAEGESIGFKRLQVYEKDVSDYVKKYNDSAIAHVWNLCGHLTMIFSMIEQIQKLQKSGATPDEMEVTALNLKSEYEAAQIGYQKLKELIPNLESNGIVDHQPQSSFYPFTDAELAALSPDELMFVCLEEMDTIGFTSPLLKKILEHSTWSIQLLCHNSELFKGRSNVDEHIAFFKQKVLSCQKQNEFLERGFDFLKDPSFGTPRSGSPCMSPGIFTPKEIPFGLQPQSVDIVTVAQVSESIQANRIKNLSTKLQKADTTNAHIRNQLNAVNKVKYKVETSLIAEQQAHLETQTTVSRLQALLDKAILEQNALKLNFDAEQERVKVLTIDLQQLETQVAQLELSRSVKDSFKVQPSIARSKSKASIEDSDFEEISSNTDEDQKETAETSPYSSGDEMQVNRKSQDGIPLESVIAQLNTQLQAAQIKADDLQTQLESAQSGISNAELGIILKLNELSTTINKIKPLEAKRNNAFESTAFLSVVMVQACIISAVCSVGVLAITAPILLAVGIGLIRNIATWVTARQALKALNADHPKEQLKALEEANPKLASVLLGVGLYKDKKPDSTDRVEGNTPIPTIV